MSDLPKDYIEILNGNDTDERTNIIDTMKNSDTKCLWNSLSDEDKRKPMMLSCPCKKCSPSCGLAYDFSGT